VGETEANALGSGGQALVAKATGLSCTTVRAGLRELNATADLLMDSATRVRRPGGGRQRLIDRDPLLAAHLDALVEPKSSTMGSRGRLPDSGV
jgi:hypothetical protein